MAKKQQPKVAPNRPAPKNPNVGNRKPAPKNPNVSGNKAVSGPGSKGAGKKKNPHAGEVYNPGVAAPTIPAYMNPEDEMSFAQARQQYEEGLHNLDFELSQARTNEVFEKEGITKQEGLDKRESTDSAAARGLFRSSIRDGDLFDISATAELRKKFLDSQLNTLELHTAAQKAAMETGFNEYMHGMQNKMVQNAQEANEGMPQYTVNPGWEKAPGGGGAGGGKNANKPNKPFKHNTALPPPNQPPVRPTKTGGTQYPGGPPPRPKGGGPSGGTTAPHRQHRILGATTA